MGVFATHHQLNVSRKGIMEYHAETSSMSQQEQGEKRRGGTKSGARDAHSSAWPAEMVEARESETLVSLETGQSQATAGSRKGQKGQEQRKAPVRAWRWRWRWRSMSGGAPFTPCVFPVPSLCLPCACVDTPVCLLRALSRVRLTRSDQTIQSSCRVQCQVRLTFGARFVT